MGVHEHERNLSGDLSGEIDDLRLARPQPDRGIAPMKRQYQEDESDVHRDFRAPPARPPFHQSISVHSPQKIVSHESGTFPLHCTAQRCTASKQATMHRSFKQRCSAVPSQHGRATLLVAQAVSTKPKIAPMSINVKVKTSGQVPCGYRQHCSLLSQDIKDMKDLGLDSDLQDLTIRDVKVRVCFTAG